MYVVDGQVERNMRVGGGTWYRLCSTCDAYTGLGGGHIYQKQSWEKTTLTRTSGYHLGDEWRMTL